MKKIVSIIFLFQFYGVSASWIVNEITNLSDLQLMQAARAKDDIEIQSISKKIENSRGLNYIQLGQQDRFGTMGGCKIIAKNPEGQIVVIRFLSDPTYRVTQGRALDSDLDSRKAAGSHQGMMARVILESQGVKKLIGYYSGYEKDNQLFNFVLKGSSGKYQVDLIPVL